MPPKDASQKTSQKNKGSNKQNGSTSKYQIIKDGWGSRPNFQYSYGLTMSPEDIEEGNAILDAMMKNDQEAGQTK